MEQINEIDVTTTGMIRFRRPEINYMVTDTIMMVSRIAPQAKLFIDKNNTGGWIRIHGEGIDFTFDVRYIVLVGTKPYVVVNTEDGPDAVILKTISIYDDLASIFRSCCPNGNEVIVTNSDGSYEVEVSGGDTLVLPDTELNVYFEEELIDTVTFPTLSPTTDIEVEYV